MTILFYKYIKYIYYLIHWKTFITIIILNISSKFTENVIASVEEISGAQLFSNNKGKSNISTQA